MEEKKREREQRAKLWTEDKWNCFVFIYDLLKNVIGFLFMHAFIPQIFID